MARNRKERRAARARGRLEPFAPDGKRARALDAAAAAADEVMRLAHGPNFLGAVLIVFLRPPDEDEAHADLYTAMGDNIGPEAVMAAAEVLGDIARRRRAGDQGTRVEELPKETLQ